MSLAAVLRASNPNQLNTVTQIRYGSRNSTAWDHGLRTGTKETPDQDLCGSFGTAHAYDVHHARVIGRMEPAPGIEPFARLVEQVMTAQPYVSADRVFG